MCIAEQSSGSSGPGPEMYDPADSDGICFLCGDPRYSPYLQSDLYGFPFMFQRCACGVIKQTPMPNEHFFEWFFNSELFFSSSTVESQRIWGYYDYFADEPDRLSTSRWRFRRLRRYLPDERPLHIMKIGPSTGTFLHVAAEAGHRVRGCDVSDRFRAWALEHYGITIDQGRFERLGYADESFDVILLLSVLENVPNQDELLRAIHDRLRPGGLLIFNYVDMQGNLIAALQRQRYSLYRPPICYLFDRTVIARLLERYGFEPLATLADLRVMSLEKILTLWGWRSKLIRALRLCRVRIPIYAYPSKIVVARRKE